MVNKSIRAVLCLVFAFSFLSVLAEVEKPLQGTVSLEGSDTPNDKGGSIDLKWKLEGDFIKNVENIFIYRMGEGEKEYKLIKKIEPSARAYSDVNEVADGKPYSYYLEFKSVKDESLYKTEVSGPYVSSPQWFHMGKIMNLVFSMIAIFIILLFINLARRGKKLYVRPLAGVKAIEDAVGRATEMGRPSVYVPGIYGISDVSTLASISILSKVADIIAEYNSRIIIPNYDPIVYSVIDEVVKNAYLKSGRPDAYKSEDVYYLTSNQFAYASGVAGLMSREKPAANFFLGTFMAESLILSESGAMTGAIQIAGTDSISQIPFFIVSCDYTLIGEELYAAGAYMGNDTKLLGGLKGQDYVKMIVMLTLFILFILKLFGVKGLETLLTGGN
jgi:hypothetical protein